MLRTWKMRAKQYIAIIPEDLIHAEVTKVWGNRKSKIWIHKNIHIDREDNILCERSDRQSTRRTNNLSERARELQRKS